MNAEHRRKRYWEKKKNGECVKCNLPAIHGTMCEYHKMLAAEYVRKSTTKRVTKGLCGNCRNPAVPGRKSCSYHLEYKKRWRDEHRSNHPETAENDA